MIIENIYQYATIESITGADSLAAPLETRMILGIGVDTSMQHDTVPDRVRIRIAHPPLHEITHKIADKDIRVVA